MNCTNEFIKSESRLCDSGSGGLVQREPSTAKINHNTVNAYTLTMNVMARAANRESQTFRRHEPNQFAHVHSVLRASDEGRLAINTPIQHSACAIVLSVGGIRERDSRHFQAIGNAGFRRH